MPRSFLVVLVVAAAVAPTAPLPSQALPADGDGGWTSPSSRDGDALDGGAATGPEDAGPDEGTPVPVPRWLLLGPVATALPAFASESPGTVTAADLCGSSALRVADLRPGERRVFPGPGPGSTVWRDVPAGGELTLTPPDGGAPALAYLATTLHARQYVDAALRLTTDHPARAYLDGRAVELEDGAGEVGVTPGPHLLVIEAARDPELDGPWQLAAELVLDPDTPATAVRWSTDPRRGVTLRDILDAPRIVDAAIAPDGKLVAVTLEEIRPDGTAESYLEILRTADGSAVRTWRGGLSIGHVDWAPRGQVLSYTTGDGDDGGSTLWAYDLTAGTTTALARGIEDLQEVRWMPDGASVVLARTDEAEPDERGVRHILHPQDRQPWWRDRVQLWQVGVPGGARRQLTAGGLGIEQWSIAPDGRALVLQRTRPTPEQRPFGVTELWRLDLETLAITSVAEDPWIGRASFGPDPDQVLVEGSADAFAGLGRDLPEGVTANPYDVQLYLLTLDDATAEALTIDLDPSITAATWSRADGRIVATAVAGQDVGLFSYDLRKGTWQRLDAGLQVIDGMDVASASHTAVTWGSGVSTPQRLTVVDLKRGKARLVLDPGAARYEDVVFGRVEPFVHTLAGGGRLDGRVYYPPDYDPQGSYPAIVYYYGGTYPVTGDFGGRYPKNLWAAHGYVVYVPEPSGAVGYGQEFSARHVNDWGRRTADEIIEGTRAFLEAHPAVDPRRVACMGASFGGFLTEYLVTRTDLFAAAVSHAGISTLSGYWGAGLWGYAYGAGAMADSYPWSDPDLFVGQSPLYRADRITTPLLLLHGADDTNVPVGESDRLFTALKLLGRPVEYVQILGQDHHVTDHDRRLVWNDTIEAFLDRQLKGQAAWWESLYPDP